MKLLNRTTLYLSATFAIVMAVWAFLMYLSMLDEIYDSIDDGLENYKLLIIDKANKDSSILYKSEFNESNYAITPISEYQAKAGKDRYADTLMFMQNENDFEPVRILHTNFEDRGKHYHLQVITSMVEEDDLIADLLGYLIALYVLIIISVIAVNNVLLRRIWRPFHTILRHLRSFDLRDPLPLRAEPSSIAEFRELSRAVDGLLRNNIDRYNSQKQFIENASHELQTPLAICINKLELLLEDDTLSPKHGQELADILDNLNRLTRLNKSLILLSNIENRQYIDTSVINFNELVKKVSEDFQPLTEFHTLSLVIDEKAVFRHAMNPDLAVILVTNLLRNTIVHSRNGSLIRIVLDGQSLIVSNPGENELDKERLFSRFYRDRRKPQSLGLGLSIVRGICELSGLFIRYRFNGGLHEFTVTSSTG